MRRLVPWWRAQNPNVRAAVLYSGLFYACRSIWISSVLAEYLFQTQDGSNSMVGLATGVQGLAQLLAAAPAGLYVDGGRRDRALRLGSVVGVVGYALTALAVASQQIEGIFASLGLLGVHVAVMQPAVESLFADSLAHGARSELFSVKHAVQRGAGCVGPALDLVYFAIFGDEWELGLVTAALLAGLALSVLPLLVVRQMSDDYSLPRAAGEEGEDEDEGEGEGDDAARSAVPWILVACDLLIACGAGATLVMFPLWFIEELDMSPTAVNAVFVATPLCVAACSVPLQRLSQHIGRPWAMIFGRSVGTVCLALLVALRDVRLIVPLYILRTGVQNGVAPLSKSILMDYVPRRSRGKWNSADSINAFSWSGSAALGGWLVDKYDYRTCFAITAVFYVAGTLALLPLTRVVQREAVASPSESQAVELSPSESQTVEPRERGLV